MTRRLGLSSRDITLLGVLTALPVLGYQFGVGNQVEQFAIVERLRDPSFLVGDFYTDSASQFGPRYYYSLPLSLLTSIAPLPLVVFLLACVSTLALAWVTFATAWARLGGTVIGAAIAAALAVTNSSFSLGLAGYLRFESFQPASIAIPLSLIGFVWLAEAKRYAAAAIFSAAALMHPLVGAEIALIAYASCALADLAARKPLVSLLAYIPSGAAFGAFFVAAWVLPGMPAETVAMSSEEFFSILPAFRAPHHYLAATFPWSHYEQLAAFVAAIALLFLQVRRSGERPVLLTALVVATGLVLALCAASFVFVDLLHNRVAATAQLFRTLFLLKWVGFVLFGVVAGRWLATGRPLFMVAPFAVLVATGEAQPYIMLAATLVVVVADRFTLGRRVELGLAAVLVLAALQLTLDIGAREEAVRAALAGFAIALLYLSPLRVPAASAIAVSTTAALIAFGWFNRQLDLVDRGIVKPTYQWADVEGEEADIARWIRANTPPRAVWITPPQFESFRLMAERPVVVDFTSIPFEEGAMREWRRRIGVVYGDVPGGGFAALQAMERNYRSVTPEKLAQLADEFNAPFAVVYSETPWRGPILYENGAYKAVSLETALTREQLSRPMKATQSS